MPRPCRSVAVLLPCRAALIHTCHAAALPFSDNAVSFVKLRVVDGNLFILLRKTVNSFTTLVIIAGSEGELRSVLENLTPYRAARRIFLIVNSQPTPWTSS
jgi:hypothetical protein